MYCLLVNSKLSKSKHKLYLLFNLMHKNKIYLQDILIYYNPVLFM